ncbi:PLP-dependent aminotransferase family protein [Leptolyngbya cf. ectocarpi LEGE 11479]|uniref:PLP-dependent aminotransferase family protein n=1 Tax=Leptolyngbya cf. ectocarpi LEGE 11479 TaxID=1828722 RepID=A0A928ZQ57_LEPEC|nr:PLP-dependent aminotransferase family protein [Leptolyngbya ectocarpi]MBE9065905.1 PLP-dependent aminotransferase family protein [Leptolyngbya cf. ectocarpi LEGE 11479]
MAVQQLSTLSLLTTATDQTLYEQVADRIQSLIREGILAPGDRLPSVRKLKRQLSVSMSTVLEAYRLLEDRGIITARPQSGYYVKATALALPDEPSQSAPPPQVRPVDISLMLRLLRTAQSPEVIQLGAAVPGVEHFPLNTLNRLVGQVMRADPMAVHSYNTVPGCEPLRREVAKRMINAGCSVAPNNIIATAGTTEAYYLALRTVTQPGDTVVIESPSYYAVLEAMNSLGLNALELPTHPRDGISLNALEAALENQSVAACFLVSNFSNPIGSCMDDNKKKKLVDLLNQYDVPLIEDDVYGDLNFEGERPKAIKAFDTEGRVIYCSSVSKTLSPGLRVGWCIPGRYHQQIEHLKVVVSHMTATAPQLAVAAFFANGGYDRHLRHLRRAYQQQMNQMFQAILNYFPSETRVTQPAGGHILWVEITGGFDALELFEKAIQHHISIAPGPMFSASNGYQNCFRLNAGLPWSDDIEQAMKTLGDLAKKQLARKILAD